MLCQNCGKNEANIKYTQMINENKKEMVLCEECANKLGIKNNFSFEFNMPIDIQSFLSEFLNEQENMLPKFTNLKEPTCTTCNMTYREFIDLGKFGCENCYNEFSTQLNQIFKNFHGNDTHVGRKGRLKLNEKAISKDENKIHEDLYKKTAESRQQDNKSEVEQLKEELKKAVKQERYEDAASLRDKIKKIENEGK